MDKDSQFDKEICRSGRNILAQLRCDNVAIAAVKIDQCGADGVRYANARLSKATYMRQAEFAAGRCAANRALKSCGAPLLPLQIGELGEPLWPNGYIGSITHDGGWAVAIASQVCSISWAFGIDLVLRNGFQSFEAIGNAILHPAERVSDYREPATLAELFSAKESAIKVLSPHLGRYVDFSELYLQGDGEMLVIKHEATGVHVDIAQCPVGSGLLTVAVGRDSGTGSK